MACAREGTSEYYGAEGDERGYADAVVDVVVCGGEVGFACWGEGEDVVVYACCLR